MKYELGLLDIGGTCALLFEEGKLCEFYPPREIKVQSGDIYLAKVERIVVGLNAAFVDLGDEKGFIYAQEVLSAQTNAPDIRSLLKAGQEIIVQVIKEALGDKRPTVTMKLSLPGKYIVFLPNTEQRSVSRKISDDLKRKQLQEMANQLALAPDTGVIIRTNAAEADLTKWQQDYDNLYKMWRNMLQNRKGRLIYKAASLTETMRRDWGNELNAVWTDSEDIYEEWKANSSINIYWREKEEIIQKFALQSQLKAAWQKKVPLKSGGYLIIDETEAMVVIDVNSGSFAAKSGTEETFARLNIEAAEEIARQLRLRNLGGIIIIDFVDMKKEESRELVYQALACAVKADKLKVNLEGWSALGLFELTRQKKGLPLSKYISSECEQCRGLGKIYHQLF